MKAHATIFKILPEVYQDTESEKFLLKLVGDLMSGIRSNMKAKVHLQTRLYAVLSNIY